MSYKVFKRDNITRIIFEDNQIPYMQDHTFKRGIPEKVEFVLTKINSGYRLIGEGYGALKDNPWGLRYDYGNGAIYVIEGDLVL